MEQRRTVLLADTSTEFRILLREAMEKTGEFWVDVAQTGDEVLEKVQEQEPDILIMDVILPGLDGLSALRELELVVARGRLYDHPRVKRDPNMERELDRLLAE